MPLKAGYGPKTISANIRVLVDEGKTTSEAIAISMAKARVSYFRSFPHGALPYGLALPSKYRMKEHYDKHGKPLHYPTSRALKENPSSLQSDIQRGKSLMQRFSGHRAKRIVRVSQKPASPVRVEIGPVLGIIYSTRRDGRKENYIHRFAAGSRPLLTATPDGKRLEMLGGAFDFTARGIVDRPRFHKR